CRRRGLCASPRRNWCSSRPRLASLRVALTATACTEIYTLSLHDALPISFLEKRTGYCIHFAGAFALMADTLGMPVRIVVGYLPGSGTDQRRDDSIVYSVTSDQLHSWPEVHFEGIGWVPFEPTATLGVPTDFIAASSGGSGDGPEAPTPTIAPTTSPSATPTDE